MKNYFRLGRPCLELRFYTVRIWPLSHANSIFGRKWFLRPGGLLCGDGSTTWVNRGDRSNWLRLPFLLQKLVSALLAGAPQKYAGRNCPRKERRNPSQLKQTSRGKAPQYIIMLMPCNIIPLSELKDWIQKIDLDRSTLKKSDLGEDQLIW